MRNLYRTTIGAAVCLLVAFCCLASAGRTSHRGRQLQNGVTSVSLTAPSIFSVSGSPVTSTGMLGLSLTSQSANMVLASPNGSSGTPSFRSLAAADLAGSPSTGQYLEYNGSGLVWNSVSGDPGSPGGSNTDVQFNSSGSFSGDAGFTYGGQAGSTLVTLTPTSTSATILGGSEPGSFTGSDVAFLDSSGSPVFEAFHNPLGTTDLDVFAQTGFSSGAFGAVRLGTNGYVTTSGNTVGALLFGLDPSGTFAQSASVQALAAENQSSGHLGTDLRVLTTATGSSSPSERVRISANGNVVLNSSGSALATSATNGFTYLPTGAGAPTGAPTSYIGAVPFYYDSTHDALLAYSNNTNLWQPINVTWVGTQITSSTTVGSGGSSSNTDQFYTIGTLSAGITVTLPKASTCPGVRITLKWAVESNSHTVTLSPASGGGNVEGGSTYTFNGSTTEYPCLVLESDGSNWWIVSSH